MELTAHSAEEWGGGGKSLPPTLLTIRACHHTQLVISVRLRTTKNHTADGFSAAAAQFCVRSL